MTRLLTWGCAAGLVACQVVAGIQGGSSGGPCANNSQCPSGEICVADRCEVKSNGGAGTGANAGGGGTSGASTNGGRANAGGGTGGASGGSGSSQAGSTAARGGDGGKGGSQSMGGESGGGEGGEGGAGDATGVGGGAGAGGRNVGGAAGSGASGGVAGASAGGVAGSAGTAAGSGGMAGTGGSGPVRIMPLGDGITASTCMRAFLWQDLSDGGYPVFDFVGTRTSGDSCAPSGYDKNNEGHAGYRVTDLLSPTSQHTDPGGDPYTGSSADLAAWFDGQPADIVLMLFGANDFLTTSSTASDVENAYSAILAKLRSVNPRVTLLVGLLPPMSTDKCNTSCASRRSDLNAALPGWAAGVSTTNSRVGIVDLSNGFDVANTTDGVKPNDTGAKFLADRWYAAIQAL